MNTFRFILNHKPDSLSVSSPAEKFKQVIDDDITFKYNLSELSEMCSYSRDHIRKLFEERFHISPLEYRKQKRMARVMELIANTKLPVNEIAAKTGFQHSSHFCMSFKKYSGITPLAAIKRFRYSN
jgi:AraC-like DNA-binding protein